MRCTSSSCFGKFQYLSLPPKSDSQVTYLFCCAKMRVRILLYSLCMFGRLINMIFSDSGILRWKACALVERSCTWKGLL